MGLFDSIKERREERRLTKLEQDLKKVKDRIGFNPYKQVVISTNTEEEERFTRRIQEFKILATGNSELIRKFYRSYTDDQKLNFFWNKATDKYIKVHAGFPKLVADKMVQLGTGAGIDIKLEVYNDNNELDEAATEKATETWKALEEQVNFIDAVAQMWFNDAVTGHDIVKFNYDLGVSQYPIIEVTDITKAEVRKVRNLTKAIIFHEYFNVGNTEYRFDETYTLNEANHPIILNQLFKRNANGTETQVPLNTIYQTAYLMEQRKPDPENPLTYIQEFEDLEGMIAFEKANKTPNNEFMNTPYGRSDIVATDISDKLDEIASEIAGEVRNNKTISFVPVTLMEHDENGEPLEWNPFITRYQKVEGSLDQNAKQEVVTQQIADKTAAHLDKAKIYMDMYCASCGLSPLSLGITSMESTGANVSGDGFRERIKTTLDTRNAKIAKFKPYIANVVRQLLAFDYWLVTKAGAKQPGLDVQNINFDNCNVIVDFGEYVANSEAEIYARVQAAKQAGIMSIETAIDEIHPDWSEEQKTLEVNRLKIEKNLSMDSPDLLQIEELDNGENS